MTKYTSSLHIINPSRCSIEFNFETKYNQQGSQMWERAKKMAKRLNCPYSTKEGESIASINTLLFQLRGIERSNALCQQMGIGPIDFMVKTQTIEEYLAEQDREETHEFLLKCLCAWQARAIVKRRLRTYQLGDKVKVQR